MVTLLRAKRSNSWSRRIWWKLADGELKALWVIEDQFPPSITRCRQGKQIDGNDADSESSGPDDGPPKKKPRAKTSIIKSKKTKQVTRKNKKRYKKKGNDTKDKLLPHDESLTNSSTATCNTSSERDWKVSNFQSSHNSCDKWLPWWLLLHTFSFTLIKMTSVMDKMIFIINKAGPTKWISKWRGHGTLASIVGHHGMVQNG